MLNMYTTLTTGLNEIQDEPAGPLRDLKLQELVTKARTSACSDSLSQNDVARQICNTLSSDQFTYDEKSSERYPSAVAHASTEFTGGVVGVGAAMVGAELAFPPAGVALGAYLLGFGITNGANVSVNEAEQAWNNLSQARQATLKLTLEQDLVGSQEALLQTMPAIFTELASSSDPSMQELGSLAKQLSTDPVVCDHIGVTSLNEDANVIDLLSPLDREVVELISNGGPDLKQNAYSTISASISATTDSASSTLLKFQ